MAEEGLKLMRAVRGKHFGSTVIAVLLVLGWAELASSKRAGRTTLVYADAFSGLVVDIIDGDTLTVLRERAPEAQGSRSAGATEAGGVQLRPVEVRLASIDALEHNQPFGTRASEYAAELAFLQQVTVEVQGRDRYGRVLGEVVLPDGRSLEQELVRAGLAWWYRQYAPVATALAQLEAEARAARRGLWAEPDPWPPWVWRHSSRARWPVPLDTPGARRARARLTSPPP